MNSFDSKVIFVDVSALPPDLSALPPGFSALPPDVRRGYAPPYTSPKHNGLRPWFGLSPSGHRPDEGRSPFVNQRAYGEAKPRLTSGGRADTSGRAAAAFLNEF